MHSPRPRPRVVIIGGGFAGVAAARALCRADVDVTLLDRTNHFIFQPLLYQVATGALAPSDITAPIRWILRRQLNTRVLMAEVRKIAPDTKSVFVDDEMREIPYDYLIVAPGARHSYFGHDEWEPYAPGLKAIEGGGYSSAAGGGVVAAGIAELRPSSTPRPMRIVPATRAADVKKGTVFPK